MPIIVNTDVQGMRKCKNFSITLQTTSNIPLQWALVYVPEGTLDNIPTLGLPNNQNAVSLYEPNQNVIMSGVIFAADMPITKRTRLARNLNSGDAIAVVACAVENAQAQAQFALYAQLNYAISF